MNPGAPGVERPSVKICGLKRREDAELAVGAGADFLGVVLVPGTPRALSPEEARDVLAGLEAPAVSVLADLPVGEAVSSAETVGAKILQLHGGESPAYAAELRDEGPWEIWKALRVREVGGLLRALDAFAGMADGILLDGWHPRFRGGSGTVFSWQEVEGVRDRFPEGLRFIAAGGLEPDNVEEAIIRLNPHVVDVSSGVEERPGFKSPEKVRAFISNVHRAGKGERG